jgi:hypothetical protein
MAHLLDKVKESDGIDSEALFSQAVLTRAGITKRTCAVMMTDYMRLRDALKAL